MFSVPPGFPSILWRDRMVPPGSLVGPVQENEFLELTCRVLGGWPTPTVTWWIGGKQITSEIGKQGTGTADDQGVVWAILRLKAYRNIFQVPIICHAQTSDLVLPKTNAASIDITCKFFIFGIENIK